MSAITGQQLRLHQPAARLQILMYLLPVLEAICRKRSGLMVGHIGHHCLFAGNEQTEGGGTPPPINEEWILCLYIVFIHAENLSLGLCFVDACLPFSHLPLLCCLVGLLSD